MTNPTLMHTKYGDYRYLKSMHTALRLKPDPSRCKRPFDYRLPYFTQFALTVFNDTVLAVRCSKLLERIVHVITRLVSLNVFNDYTCWRSQYPQHVESRMAFCSAFSASNTERW